MKNQTVYRYLVFVWGGVDAQLHGPFESEDDREAAARQLIRDEESSVHWLDVDSPAVPTVDVGDYSGAFAEAAALEEGAAERAGVAEGAGGIPLD